MTSERGGQPSISERYGDPTSRVPITITDSQKEFLMTAMGGIAQGVRTLVDAAIDDHSPDYPKQFSVDFLRQVISELEELKRNHTEAEILAILRQHSAE